MTALKEEEVDKTHVGLEDNEGTNHNILQLVSTRQGGEPEIDTSETDRAQLRS